MAGVSMEKSFAINRITHTERQYQSSLSQAAPVVLTPIMGYVVHRFGKRLTIRRFYV